MSVADLGLMVSVLVVVAIVAKMLRAIRLLNGRVTLLQEQLQHSHTAIQKVTTAKSANPRPVPARPTSGKTPVQGVPIVSGGAPHRTPAPVVIDDAASGEYRTPGEMTAHVIDEAEAEALWAKMSAEQERLQKAMGRDFQVTTPKRSATAIRGKPVVRALSSRELASKLERK